MVVIKTLSNKSKSTSVYDIIDNLSYPVKRDALLHSIEVLANEGYINRLHLENRRRMFGVSDKTLAVIG